MRDYLYVDWDRVRVLASQVSPEAAATGAETRAGQAAVFAALEQALAAKPGVTDVVGGFDFASWTPDAFRDGQFVRTTGMVRLLDYPWLASVMETMPKMLKVTQRTELSALKQKREAHQITQQEVDEKVKEHQRQLKDLEGWRMEELTEVVRELFGQTVRMKIVPRGAERGEMFVGTCLPGGFFESPAILSQKYGCDVDAGSAGGAGWQVLGIINAGRETGTPPMPTGNSVEDMFERLALAVNRIHRVANSPTFPALSLTPLAIYREL